MTHNIEAVVAAFESWRATRQSRSEAIPEHLWSMAKKLVPYYKKSHIQSALRISGKHFKAYCLVEDITTSQATISGFASATMTAAMIGVHEDNCELTLNGVHRSLSIKTSIGHLSKVLSAVEGYI
ncbi:MAG: hypothetical protein EBX50_15655 [Chitinophagia bacterium]|nr:hypothetical protein [Chitinophagia bacterium]